MKTATCVECNRSITYTTNKPKRCKSCKTDREKRFASYKRKAPSKSKKEGLMQQRLNKILPEADYIDNGYYSWLLSPKGAPLQLDRYYPDLKVAFEFNGRQHYEYNPYMHETEENFRYLQRCDIKKRRECKKRGVTLITIKYTKKITDDYLIKRLEQEGVISDIEQQTMVVY